MTSVVIAVLRRRRRRTNRRRGERRRRRRIDRLLPRVARDRTFVGSSEHHEHRRPHSRLLLRHARPASRPRARASQVPGTRPRRRGGGPPRLGAADRRLGGHLQTARAVPHPLRLRAVIGAEPAEVAHGEAKGSRGDGSGPFAAAIERRDRRRISTQPEPGMGAASSSSPFRSTADSSGAGLGIMLLAVLGLFSDAGLVRNNAVKQALSVVISVIAATFLAFTGHVEWTYAWIMAVTSTIGGAIGGQRGELRQPSGAARRSRLAWLRGRCALLGLKFGTPP